MPQRHLESFLRCLRRWAGAEGALGLTDGQLLERFVSRREDSAFEAIVRSHGPMVFGLCRRLLNNAHDAEDAFQATFLVLARKASSISKRESVGSWLFGVAYRIAARERSRQAQRRYAEREMSAVPCRSMGSGGDAAENWTILSEELSRLPEKYRAPLVLHYLEGKTKDEAAQQLGWPEGTVSGRLARGRAMLRGRLVKRGLTASAALIASGFAGNEVLATVPQTLLGAVLQNATLSVTGKVASASAISPKVLALAEGVQRAMLLTKIKIVAAFLMAASLIFVGTVWTVAALPAGQADEKPTSAPKPEAKQTQKPKTDLERMQGAWEVIFKKESGDEIPKQRIERWDHHFIVRSDSVVIRDRSKILEGTIKLSPAPNPKTINVTIGKGAEERKGIYVFEGDKLKICWAGWERQRPTKFSAEKEDKGDWIMILERDSSIKKELEEQAQKNQDKEARLRIAGSLYELGRAMHKYHFEHGHFPHAAIANKEGRALLSWRVALLPSLGFEELHKEFKLDEPWDSPHNKTLLAKMPKVFSAPDGGKKQDQATYYQVFIGKDTVFMDDKDVAFQDITDGTSQTILIIEAGKPVPWTKPEDLTYSADKPVPELGGAVEDGLFSFVTADAAPHYARRALNKEFEDNLRTFITANGGEISSWEAIGVEGP